MLYSNPGIGGVSKLKKNRKKETKQMEKCCETNSKMFRNLMGGVKVESTKLFFLIG